MALVAAMKAVLHETHFSWISFSALSEMESVPPLSRRNLNSHSIVRAADICVGSLSIGRMNELGSLIPSKRREKRKEPDFGTYHHSTSVASKKARAIVKATLTDAFSSLPFGRKEELRILDVGCGLGFHKLAAVSVLNSTRTRG